MNKAAITLRSIIFCAYATGWSTGLLGGALTDLPAVVWAFFACWTAGTSVVLILADARLEYGGQSSCVRRRFLWPNLSCSGGKHRPCLDCDHRYSIHDNRVSGILSLI